MIRRKKTDGMKKELNARICYFVFLLNEPIIQLDFSMFNWNKRKHVMLS